MSAKVQSAGLAWIVVQDLDKALKFFTEVLGLKVLSRADEWGWAELAGEDGVAILGVAHSAHETQVKPGQNAIMTFTVSDIEHSKSAMAKKGAELVGEVMEIPGHVKLQSFKDKDGNLFQLVQTLY